MVRYAAKHKLYLGCNLNHYFTKTAELAKQYMDEDKIGETVYALFKMGFDGGEFSYGGKGTARFNQAYGHMKAFLTHPFSVMSPRLRDSVGRMQREFQQPQSGGLRSTGYRGGYHGGR